MLTTKNLSYKYKNGKIFNFPDLSVKDGELLLILGQSGVGKSTLLHLLGGLMYPESGNITINRKNLKTLNKQSLDHFRGQQIGIVFQKNYFLNSLNVYENIALAQSLAGKKVDKNRILETLNTLGIEDMVNSKTNNLSQGEKQRVSIARAVVNKPSLILADEPTSALDDFHCNEVITLLKNQAKINNSSMVIVTHDSRLRDKLSNVVTLTSTLVE